MGKNLDAGQAMTPCSSMSSHTKERVTMIKVTLENFYMTLENFYSNLIKLEEVMEEEGLKFVGCENVL
uniref:Uncharacterized protein n=1 Tax=Capra hircus TaxID=9925 RepID=A0A8C2SA99_CAPHI